MTKTFSGTKHLSVTVSHFHSLGDTYAKSSDTALMLLKEENYTYEYVTVRDNHKTSRAHSALTSLQSDERLITLIYLASSYYPTLHNQYRS
jgi:hypothetical protein